MAVEMIAVRTWGRFGSHDRLGDIRVRVSDDDYSICGVVAASIARRLGLSICAGPREEGTSLDSHGQPESRHYAVTLGRPCRGGGYTPEAEVWYAIPHRKNPAAVALGRKGGLAGTGSLARRAAAYSGGRARWGAPVWERQTEWTHTAITARPGGWVVAHTSRIQGELTGSRRLVPYSEDIPQGQDLGADWNDGTTYGDVLVERSQGPGVRTLRSGTVVA